MKILIPPPPSDLSRIAELPFVARRYANPITPREKMALLDEELHEYFSEKLVELGLPSHSKELHDIADSLVPIILAHKNHFNSARPYQLALHANIPFEYDDLSSARTPSYPSGHTTQAYVIAFALSDAYPEHRTTWLTTAKEIAESRIDRGVHVPSDNDAGRQLALELFAISKLRPSLKQD